MADTPPSARYPRRRARPASAPAPLVPAPKRRRAAEPPAPRRSPSPAPSADAMLSGGPEVPERRAGRAGPGARRPPARAAPRRAPPEAGPSPGGGASSSAAPAPRASGGATRRAPARAPSRSPSPEPGPLSPARTPRRARGPAPQRVVPAHPPRLRLPRIRDLEDEELFAMYSSSLGAEAGPGAGATGPSAGPGATASAPASAPPFRRWRLITSLDGQRLEAELQACLREAFTERPVSAPRRGAGPTAQVDPMELTCDQYASVFRGDPAAAAGALLNVLLGLAGLSGVRLAEVLAADPGDALRQIEQLADQQSGRALGLAPAYPVGQRTSRAGRTARTNLQTFWRLLPRSLGPGLLLSEQVAGALLAWVVECSESRLRGLRHTATLCCLAFITGLADCVLELTALTPKSHDLLSPEQEHALLELALGDRGPVRAAAGPFVAEYIARRQPGSGAAPAGSAAPRSLSTGARARQLTVALARAATDPDAHARDLKRACWLLVLLGPEGVDVARAARLVDCLWADLVGLRQPGPLAGALVRQGLAAGAPAGSARRPGNSVAARLLAGAPATGAASPLLRLTDPERRAGLAVLLASARRCLGLDPAGPAPWSPVEPLQQRLARAPDRPATPPPDAPAAGSPAAGRPDTWATPAGLAEALAPAFGALIRLFAPEPDTLPWLLDLAGCLDLVALDRAAGSAPGSDGPAPSEGPEPGAASPTEHLALACYEQLEVCPVPAGPGPGLFRPLARTLRQIFAGGLDRLAAGPALRRRHAASLAGLHRALAEALASSAEAPADPGHEDALGRQARHLEALLAVDLPSEYRAPYGLLHRAASPLCEVVRPLAAGTLLEDLLDRALDLTRALHGIHVRRVATGSGAPGPAGGALMAGLGALCMLLLLAAAAEADEPTGTVARTFSRWTELAEILLEEGASAHVQGATFGSLCDLLCVFESLPPGGQLPTMPDDMLASFGQWIAAYLVDPSVPVPDRETALAAFCRLCLLRRPADRTRLLTVALLSSLPMPETCSLLLCDAFGYAAPAIASSPAFLHIAFPLLVKSLASYMDGHQRTLTYMRGVCSLVRHLHRLAADRVEFADDPPGQLPADPPDDLPSAVPLFEHLTAWICRAALDAALHGDADRLTRALGTFRILEHLTPMLDPTEANALLEQTDRIVIESAVTAAHPETGAPETVTLDPSPDDPRWVDYGAFLRGLAGRAGAHFQTA
ncbi:hypothetical protein H696_02744 [Fonticula alba]|uniref:STAG domain-containing protein n=1 Tax=Fonticula alba TaxID=691883 RepID=A0A058Z902_FONAL|nr:hypothetical protein H696_02744 [Fonticula alba]KCV70408.1 hypothetical protein H696_02744 [Fonticula alba]|eukprot:XP_009494924.1 hypothetical protein H696_02744 [Fonticula alba]